MTSWMLNITFDCREPALVARFWAGVTGWPLQQQDDTPGHEEFSVGPPAGAELPASGPRLYFVGVPEPKTVKNRVHLDMVPSSGSQEEEIARLVALGATVLEDPPPDGGWVIMADPEGHEFCLEVGWPGVEDLPVFQLTLHRPAGRQRDNAGHAGDQGQCAASGTAA
jgi:hypothetical protein